MPAPARAQCLLAAGVLALLGCNAAAVERSICVTDPVGAGGAIVARRQDDVVTACEAGTPFDLRRIPTTAWPPTISTPGAATQSN